MCRKLFYFFLFLFIREVFGTLDVTTSLLFHFKRKSKWKSFILRLIKGILIGTIISHFFTQHIESISVLSKGGVSIRLTWEEMRTKLSFLNFLSPFGRAEDKGSRRPLLRIRAPAALVHPCTSRCPYGLVVGPPYAEPNADRDDARPEGNFLISCPFGRAEDE